MSLINQMLKDLDRRKGGNEPERLPEGIRVVEAGRGGHPRLVWGLALTVVAGVAAAGVWWYSHRATPPEPLSASKRWPDSDQSQVTAASAPPQPIVAAPIAPPPPPSGPPHSISEPLAATAPAAPVADPPAAAPKSSRTAVPVPTKRPPKHKRRHPQRPAYTLPEPGPADSGNGAEEFYRQGLRSFRRGFYQEAQRQLERSLELAPDHRAARSLLARSYLAAGQYQRAEAVLGDGAVEQDEEAARLKAQIYLKQGRAEAAEQVLDRSAGTAEPADLGVRGALKQQQGRYGEAEQLYRGALKAQPGEARWWLGLGISLEAEERYQEAIDAYRRALETGSAGAARRYAESRLGALRAVR